MEAIELPESGALLTALPPAEVLIRSPAVAHSWGDPSELTGFSVGGLAGHLFRAVERLLATLDGPSPEGEPAGPADWYLGNRRAGPTGPDDDLAKLIVADGERLAAQGPNTVASELASVARRIRARLAEADADRTVAVARTDRPVPLRDYIGTRLLEVVVHADDLALSAACESADLGPDVLAAASELLFTMARDRSGDLAVVRALTRAERVADPYEVLRVL